MYDRRVRESAIENEPTRFRISLSRSLLCDHRGSGFDISEICRPVASPFVPGSDIQSIGGSGAFQLDIFPSRYAAETPLCANQHCAHHRAVSWIRPTTEERLENVARRYEMEENEQRTSERARAGRAERGNQVERQRKARSYSSYVRSR